MRNLLRLVLCFLAIAISGGALQACSPPIAIELFNNAGIPLTVKGCKQLVAISPGSVGELESIYACSAQVQIEGDGASWSYTLRAPSHNLGETGKYYYHAKGLFSSTLVVRLQINSDRRVFALPRDSSFPSPIDVPQPIGFPWEPLP